MTNTSAKSGLQKLAVSSRILIEGWEGKDYSEETMMEPRISETVMCTKKGI